MVAVAGSEETTLFGVFPNPARSYVNIELSSTSVSSTSQTVTIEVSDVMGRVFINRPAVLQPGQSVYRLDQLDWLAAGSYFITVRRDGVVLGTEQIVIEE